MKPSVTRSTGTWTLHSAKLRLLPRCRKARLPAGVPGCLLTLLVAGTLLAGPADASPQRLQAAPPAGSASETPATLRWELRGRGYESDLRLPVLVGFLQDRARESLARARGTLGAQPGVLGVAWILDVSPPPGGPPDAPAEEGALGPASRGAAADGGRDSGAQRPPGDSSPAFLTCEGFEAGRTRFAEGRVEVILPARKYLARPEDAGPVVDHEVAHALLASALGTRARYQAVAPWFREGIALWFSGEGSLRVRETLAYALYQGRSAESLLAGLPGSPVLRPGVSVLPWVPLATLRGEPTPAAAYLAVRWLESRMGPHGTRKVFEDVAAGRDLNVVLRTRVGASPEDFERWILADCREHVRRLLGANEERLFLEAMALRAAGQRDKEIEAWRSLLAGDPLGLLSSTARYLLAKAPPSPPGEVAAAYPAARRELESLLSEPGALWRPEAMVLLGDLLLREGRITEARRWWTEAIEVYGEDAGPAARARRSLAGAAAAKAVP